MAFDDDYDTLSARTLADKVRSAEKRIEKLTALLERVNADPGDLDDKVKYDIRKALGKTW